MKKDDYYDLMCKMDSEMEFDELHYKWHQCFTHFLKSLRLGYNQKIIDSLFYDFDMENWKDLHKENTEYSETTSQELVEEFTGECHYICDRMSYDRLFRTHWLFKQAFDKEFMKIKYPSLYE